MNGTQAGQLRLAAAYLLLRTVTGWIGTLLAFVALGVMSLRFAEGDSDGPAGSPPSRGAAVAYRSCGGFILACVALAAVSNALPASVKSAWPLLFIFEALAVFAFGISWFVKG